MGFSGGLDSTVLVYALSQIPKLKKKLIAVHINHGLSPNANAWEVHCQQFCQQQKVPLIAYQLRLNITSNIEKLAREKRYEVFTTLLRDNTCLLLGHHRDDQAETLLLQLFRGAGIEGLSAMPAWRSLGQGLIFRPLLDYTRAEIEAFANDHRLPWINDESNEKTHFSRNFLRHTLMPLIKQRWPGINDNLARTAAHCQQAQRLLNDLALIDCPQLQERSDILDCAALLTLDKDRLNNIIRYWLKQNQVTMPDSLTFNRITSELLLSRSDAAAVVNWGRVVIRRYKTCLFLENKPMVPKLSRIAWHDFPETLVAPAMSIKAIPAPAGIRILPDDEVEILFRQGGEQIRLHRQSKSLKKLFQEWQVPQWLREKIPLLYINGELAMVIGYAISDTFFQKDLPHTYVIESKPGTSENPS
ncbi:cell cycle protein MesJ [Legionella birminghamensis]|uniref:tRNA(Ile)-lysidine synthase n=1 Tax=Legionella birminghamensis TaxID=28083 RepID=A0A378I8D4_9GAMM|nr:tRNA lysidine(34) synthetase TilS [Legionella birminghamensis]KTC67988.1 cell cycle protein MesJ [Legionella birminghamensis]STX31303.1 cell cycle protein MesJ [Legionella birminghamensis]